MFLVAVFVCLFVFFVLFRKCQNCLLGLLICLVSWRIMFHDAKACYIYRAVGDPGERPGGPAPPLLFLDQIVARRVEKLFLRPPPPPPPPYLKVSIRPRGGTGSPVYVQLQNFNQS